MLLVGLLIYGLQQRFGHYYVEGVGYATVQAFLLGQVSGTVLLLVLFLSKGLATTLSLGSGSSGGIFSPSLYLGATLGGAFASLLVVWHAPVALDVPSFADGRHGRDGRRRHGCRDDGCTMIFEMTRDYSIVLPMIVAVAVSIGVRRVLSRESIYTLKLLRRGHVVPKALHVNMFLVQHAKDVMSREFMVSPADARCSDLFAGLESSGRPLYLIPVDANGIRGVLRVNATLGHALQVGRPDARLRDVASPHFVLVAEEEVVSNVIGALWQGQVQMALVTRRPGSRLPADLVGVISKDQVADSVASSLAIYPE